MLTSVRLLRVSCGLLVKCVSSLVYELVFLHLLHKGEIKCRSCHLAVTGVLIRLGNKGLCPALKQHFIKPWSLLIAIPITLLCFAAGEAWRALELWFSDIFKHVL